jgi:hypothetical protein
VPHGGKNVGDGHAELLIIVHDPRPQTPEPRGR